MLSNLLALLPLLAAPALAQYTATYTVGSLPDKTEGDGQTGTNKCGTTSSDSSMCQNVFLNGADDFCLWGPPATPGSADWNKLTVGHIEEIVVSYCLKEGYGTRLIPAGTIQNAHFVKVTSSKVSYVQVTGNGDLTKIGLVAGDDGGELDPHSWTGLGNPQGGLVFTNAFTGQYQQLHEWTSFMSGGSYCIRGCQDGPNAAAYCEHIYDVLGCGFTIPGSYDPGFDTCNGDPTDEAPGVYGGSTFHQDEGPTPAPHPAGATSQCTPFSTIGGGSANVAAVTSISSASVSRNSTSSSGSMSSSSGSGSSSVTSTTSMSMVTSRSSSSATAAPSSSSGSASAAAAAATSSRSAGERVAGLGGLSVFGVVGAIGALAGGLAVFA